MHVVHAEQPRNSRWHLDLEPRQIEMFRRTFEKDMTGLPGVFDITLDFAADGLAAGDNDPVPDVFAALQQIGLQLEPRKSPIEVLVIDHAEKPDAN